MSIKKISVNGVQHGTPQWHEIRDKFGIGGSDASTVVGMNKYKSRFTLFCQMTKRTKPFEGNLTTEVGSFLEEFVAKKFENMTGLRVQRSNYLYYNDEFPNQHALPDRICFYREGADQSLQGLNIGLEIKTTNSFGRFRQGFPQQYYCQCVQYLSVMSYYDMWALAVMVGNREIHLFCLKRSDEIPSPSWAQVTLTVPNEDIVALRDACNEFMDMVNKDIAPLADGEESTEDALSEVYDKAVEGTSIQLDCVDLIHEYLVASEELKNAKKKADAYKNALKSILGAYETGVCGQTKVTWKNYSRESIDSKRLKEEMPEIYAKYSKVETGRKFNVSRGEE